MEGLVCLGLVAALIGVLIWQFIESRNAVLVTVVETAHDPADAARIVQEEFNGARMVLWASAPGPGRINMRRRGLRGGITMSIDVHDRAGGGSVVEMWASRTVVYLGLLVNFAGVVNRRKKAIGRALTQTATIGTV